MSAALELLRQGRREDIWQRYCGFIDLTLEEFMEIQRRLLMEQIDLLSGCELGRRLLVERVPTSIEEFRRMVPLTGYDDYLPDLAERREDRLPRKPKWWMHTSGRSGHSYKWVPVTEEAAEKLGEGVMAVITFASCSRRGEFVLNEGDTMIFSLAPFPYFSGAIARAWKEEFNLTFLPPLEQAEQMEFAERIQTGFQMALRSGLDTFNGIGSVLIRISEQFSESAGRSRFSTEMLHPQVLFRLARGVLRSRMHGRNYLLPKDIWDVKALTTGGTDTVIYRDRIAELWGRQPVEAYSCTEAAGITSTQAWNAKGLTFFPDVNFLEFIPEEESRRSREDPTLQPETLLLDEVQAGERYELVITNLSGGVFVRYRIGDLIEITSLEDKETGVALPQMAFYARCDDVIDLAGFTRLTETDIWQALEAAAVPYVDWTVRKEYLGQKAVLHLYIELKGDEDPDDVKSAVHGQLRKLHEPYSELEDMLQIDPLSVTVLDPDSFGRYYRQQQSEGADLAHMKPPHVNASDETINRLLASVT